MSSVEDYQRLKRAADTARREAEKSQGALEQTLQQLKEDWGVSTLEEAEELLASKQRTLEEVEAEFETAFDEWKEKWGDLV